MCIYICTLYIGTLGFNMQVCGVKAVMRAASSTVGYYCDYPDIQIRFKLIMKQKGPAYHCRARHMRLLFWTISKYEPEPTLLVSSIEQVLSDCRNTRWVDAEIRDLYRLNFIVS